MDREDWHIFWRILWICISAGIMIWIGIICLGTCNTATKMVQDGQNTIYEQYKPSELLKKYEWFKDAGAQLDAKVATLHTYESRREEMTKDYTSDRSKWPRDVREQSSVWESEYLGVKASYNSLAADYNAQMAKFNYRFCNVGTLPQGSTEPLPREFKPYIDK